jgi:hypothetical protein
MPAFFISILLRKTFSCHKDTKTQRIHQDYYTNIQHFVKLSALVPWWHYYFFDLSEWTQFIFKTTSAGKSPINERMTGFYLNLRKNSVSL